eukprot:scaffold10055_cov68-Phaeocystis_antarctica.AAC.5
MVAQTTPRGLPRSARILHAASLPSPPRRERVLVLPGGDARWLCSKARRRCYIDKHGVFVREVSTPSLEVVDPSMSIGSKPTLALPANPKPTLLATPVQPDIFPMHLMHNLPAPVPHDGSIQVAENSLGLVAAEVVVVVAQKCQSFLQYNSSDSSDSCSVSSGDSSPSSVIVVAQQLVPSSLSLKEIFIMHVAPDFTPRVPKAFHMLKWATLEQLILRLQQHAPAEVARLGPQNLRQLITEWYKDHPAFAGLCFSEWGKRLKDLHPHAHPRSLTYKFCFEFTPGGVGL